MAPNDRPVDRGRRQAGRLRAELGDEIRAARLAAGLGQARVASSAGISQPELSRIERALIQSVSLEVLCRILAVLGHRLSAKAYPEGPPLRDAGQAALLQRMRARTSSVLRWRYEVRVVSTPGDLRAWDAEIQGLELPMRIDAVTRISDVQQLLRSLHLKARDSSEGRVALLVAASRRNRRILAEYGDLLSADLPLTTGPILAALRQDRDPGANGIVVL